MTLFVDDPDFQLHVGSAVDVLRTLPDESVHCVVTSPPYWGLRDYGTGTWEGGDPDCDHKQETRHQVQGATSQRQGRANAEEQRNENFRDACGKCGARRVDRQLGLEPTPQDYVARMVDVFQEVRRVLRLDGTCWLNLGDSYASNPGKGGSGPGAKRPGSGRADGIVDTRAQRNRDGVPPSHGLKEKDLVGIPWRVAFALQDDGWYLRSDIIWAKPNPMPESVTDRPTKAHEYLFLLTRSARYFYDADAIREAYVYPGDVGRPRETTHAPGQPPHSTARARTAGPDGRRVTVVSGADGSLQHRNGERWPNPSGRNARSVWEIATQPYAEAHFATFPEELPRRCIAAGCPTRVCATCGKPLTADVILTPTGSGPSEDPTMHTGRKGMNRPRRDDEGVRAITRAEQHAYARQMRVSPTAAEAPAACCEGREAPGVVLDPFMGSGTTALVARKLGRRSIGIELNPEYAALAARRLQQQSLFA